MTIAYLEDDPTSKLIHDFRSRFVIHSNSGIILGKLINRRHEGWRFYPWYQASPSRKGWPTPNQAVKGYGIKLTAT